MTVDEFADVLSGSRLELLEDSQYQNRKGQPGYRAVYRGAGCYYWYSVSGTEIRFAPDEVAILIRSPKRIVMREYPYQNASGQQGFEARVFSGDHHFMLNLSPDPPQN